MFITSSTQQCLRLSGERAQTEEVGRKDIGRPERTDDRTINNPETAPSQLEPLHELAKVVEHVAIPGQWP